MDINLKKPVLKAGLYIIATPIGNLGDISLRALETLGAVDALYCEDTRMSGKLLSYFGLKKSLYIYNDHSDARQRDEIFARIRGGDSVGLVSDAGMPLVSDPGYKLVRAANEAGLYVTTLPGANAPLSALQLSGLPSDQFSFLGFLPSKQKARQDYLRNWAQVPSTLVAFETAPRLLKALADIDAVLGGREVSVVREITKKFEEVRNGTAQSLVAYYEDEGLPKGEIVLVIAPPIKKDLDDDDLAALLKDALKDMRTKDAAAFVAEQTGVAKSKLYKMALEVE